MRDLGTQQVTAYHFNAERYSIWPVNTLGFDDTYKLDTDILLELVKWLEAAHRR